MTKKAEKQDSHRACMGFINAGLPFPRLERNVARPGQTCMKPAIQLTNQVHSGFLKSYTGTQSPKEIPYTCTGH